LRDKTARGGSPLSAAPGTRICVTLDDDQASLKRDISVSNSHNTCE